MKNYLKNIDWLKFAYPILLLIFTFFINFYTVNQAILANVINLTKTFQNQLIVSLVLFILSIIGVSFYLIEHLNWKFLLKLLIGYVLYLLVAYFLIITRNLNNTKFKIWSLSHNGFWQWDFLLVIILIILFAFLGKLLGKHIKFLRVYPSISDKPYYDNLLLAILVASAALNNSVYIATLKETTASLIVQQKFDIYLANLVSILLLSLIGLILLVYTCFESTRDLRKNQPSISLIFIFSALFAVIFNYALQWGVSTNGALLGKFIFPGATLYQVSLLIVVYLLAYFIINRFMVTTFIILISGILISAVNAVKQDLRSEPLLITDFIWLQQPELLLKFVNIGTVIITLILIIAVSALLFFLRKKVLPGPIIKKKRIRFGLIAALICLSLSVFSIFRNEEDSRIINGIPIISKVNNWYDINWMGFSTNARYKSLMYVWTKQLTKSIMDTPEGYSEKKMDEISEKYTKLAKKINESRKNSISSQTVIYILSESFSDPSRVDGVTLSQDVIPNIRKIKQTTTSGLMQSDGYGGGTANMEFQALTGIPFYNFSSSVSVLYTEVVPKMTVFPSISNQFQSKNRFVLHPSGANNYGRKNIYTKLGFSDLVFTSDSKDDFSNKKFTGVSISDKTLYNNILQRLDTSQSQFFSAITMQNHVPWVVGEPEDVSASGDDFTNDENEALSNYARLLTHTDTSTKDFLDKLSNIDKKVTVVFYGDHLPGFYPDSAFMNNPKSKYQTDYFIWSNFKTPKMNYPLVNSSDFTAELFKQTNSKVSPYYALLTEVLDNASVDREKLDKKQKEIAEDLKLVQYDITLGKNYISSNKDFFKIK